MANILIFVTESHRFGYYESLLEDVKQRSTNHYHIVYDSPRVKSIIDRYEGENLSGYLLPEKFSHLQGWGKVTSIMSALNRRFYETFGVRLAEKYLRRVLSKQFNALVSLLDHTLPKLTFDLVLLSSDRAVNDLRALYYAHQKQIKSAVIPTAGYGSFQSMKNYRKTYKVTPEFPLVKKHPVFDKLKSYNDMSYYAGYLAAFLDSKSILSPDPFTMGMGAIDYVGCQSRASIDECLSAGVLKDKIFSVPEPNVLSLLRDAEQAENDQEPYLLVSLPQWWEHNLLPKDEHLRHLQEFITWLKKHFDDLKFKVSLHPKSDPSDYQEFLVGNELERVEPLKKYINNASIFASTYSTTIAWALACNVPTVLYDPIGLNTKEYHGLTSILIRDEMNSDFDKPAWLNGIDTDKDRVQYGQVIDLNCDAVFTDLIRSERTVTN